MNAPCYRQASTVDRGLKTIHAVDDGCDWSDWLVWSMNARRRISESRFALPPVPQRVSKRTAKNKKRMRRTHKAAVLIEQMMS